MGERWTYTDMNSYSTQLCESRKVTQAFLASNLVTIKQGKIYLLLQGLNEILSVKDPLQSLVLSEWGCISYWVVLPTFCINSPAEAEVTAMLHTGNMVLKLL